MPIGLNSQDSDNFSQIRPFDTFLTESAPVRAGDSSLLLDIPHNWYLVRAGPQPPPFRQPS